MPNEKFEKIEKIIGKYGIEFEVSEVESTLFVQVYDSAKKIENPKNEMAKISLELRKLNLGYPFVSFRVYNESIETPKNYKFGLSHV